LWFIFTIEAAVQQRPDAAVMQLKRPRTRPAFSHATTAAD
jgi:hypothetical protein